MLDNYPPGVSGNEPEITGEMGCEYCGRENLPYGMTMCNECATNEENCAYCESGVAELHTHQARVCIDCGDEVQSLDNQGRCVPCILMAQMNAVIKTIEKGAK